MVTLSEKILIMFISQWIEIYQRIPNQEWQQGISLSYTNLLLTHLNYFWQVNCNFLLLLQLSAMFVAVLVTSILQLHYSLILFALYPTGRGDMSLF